MTYLLRLSACLFLCVSLNSYGSYLYGRDDASNLVAFDLSNNQTTIISPNGSYGLSTYEGFTFGPSPVPLPAGIYLFLSGLVGLGLMRGRNG